MGSSNQRDIPEQTISTYSSLVEADLATGVSGGVFCFYCMLFRYGRVLTNTVGTNVTREHAKEYLFNFTGRIVDVSMDRLMDGDEMAFHLCEVSQGYGQLEASVCVRLVTTASCVRGIRIWIDST